MSITGRIKETKIFGPSLELRRTISGTLGQPVIRIHDEVINRGNTPMPHMLLYHFNFGWPLVDEGTDIIWQGDWQAREGGINDEIFREGNDFRNLPGSAGRRTAARAKRWLLLMLLPISPGQCTAGLYNAKLGLAMALRFQKEQLPWLINWQHWGKGEYVTGLEPATNPLIGQAKAREQSDTPVSGNRVKPGRTTWKWKF